jgi:hypothetical protein
MTKRLMIFTATLALAACSASAAPNTAVTAQSGPDLAFAPETAPPQPPVADVIPPPLIVPEAVAPAVVAPPVVAPENLTPAPVIKARFSCDIEVKRTSHGIRITPVVHADRAMAGEYSLMITKSGASGSSDINQGGPFDAARNEEIALSASEFSLERGDRYRAVLKVRSGGREICRDIRS